MEYPIHDIPESRTPLEKKNNRLNQTTKLSNKKNPKMLLNCR